MQIQGEVQKITALGSGQRDKPHWPCEITTIQQIDTEYKGTLQQRHTPEERRDNNGQVSVTGWQERGNSDTPELTKEKTQGS